MSEESAAFCSIQKGQIAGSSERWVPTDTAPQPRRQQASSKQLELAMVRGSQ